MLQSLVSRAGSFSESFIQRRKPTGKADVQSAEAGALSLWNWNCTGCMVSITIKEGKDKSELSGVLASSTDVSPKAEAIILSQLRAPFGQTTCILKC